MASRLARPGTSNLFVKLNDAHHHEMFTAEAAGLEALAGTGTVRVSQPVVHGCCGTQSFLVLENLALQSRGNSTQLGERLAALHRCTASRFGFAGDNFLGTTPQPSLLHGDLWGGNHGYLADGAPAIFDPAAYYGDRECDLSMTELFGGYDADFYAAYRASYPPDVGYAVRKELYNLYHILNHANLFGGGYARKAEGTMQRLLAEAG